MSRTVSLYLGPRICVFRDLNRFDALLKMAQCIFWKSQTCQTHWFCHVSTHNSSPEVEHHTRVKLHLHRLSLRSIDTANAHGTHGTYLAKLSLSQAQPACAGRMGSNRWFKSFRPTSRTVFSMWSICLNSAQLTVDCLNLSEFVWIYNLIMKTYENCSTLHDPESPNFDRAQLSVGPKNVRLKQWQFVVDTCWG